MPTLAGAQRTETSPYDLWYVPEQPVSIYLSHEAERAILEQDLRGIFRRRREEAGGILLGTVERERGLLTIRIEDVAAIPCEHLFGPSYTLSESDKQAFRRALEAGGPLEPVGFYRTHVRDGLSLDPEDVQFFSELFPEPEHVALLVKPRKLRASRAAFFVRENGLVRITSYLDFPVSRKPHKPYIAPAAKYRLDPGKAPARRGAPLWCNWWVQAPLLTALLFADALLGFVCAREWNRILPPAPQARDPYALSLMVLEYGENLHLTWDQQSLPVAAAESGLLQISDGQQSRSMELTREQLRKGSVVYRKVTQDVQLRLEVQLRQSRSVAEVWTSKAQAPRGTANPAR